MPVDLVLESRTRELTEGFKVRRVLPSSKRRMVGPFIFVDQMGPELLSVGRGLDVAPHPHIGLATVTYLFKGELIHRDSLGTIQAIKSGDVNWMTAGSGIAHSERTPPQLRTTGGELFGVQSWVALPERYEEVDPTFSHHGVNDLPVIDDSGVFIRLIAGSLYGAESPVRTYSEMFYADVMLSKEGKVAIPSEHEERAVFVLEGDLSVAKEDRTFVPGQLILLKPGVEIDLAPTGESVRFLFLGGEPVGKRHIWWNFVSSSHDRIEQAKRDWQAEKFAKVPGETEFIPLPVDQRSTVVRYP